MTEERRLLTAEDVVRRLGLVEGHKNGIHGAVRALNRLRRLHSIPAVKLGRRFVYTEDSVARIIACCTVSADERDD